MFELDTAGAGLALTLTDLLLFAFITIYITLKKEFKESWILPNKDVLKDLKPYIKLAIYATLMLAAEWWLFELLTLISGYLSVEETATQVSLIGLSVQIYTISLGLASGAAVTVGNALGEGNIIKAKEYARLSLLIAVITFACFTILLNIFRFKIASIYTDDEELRDHIAYAFIFLSVSITFDGT